jgi:hypothetical protein
MVARYALIILSVLSFACFAQSKEEKKEDKKEVTTVVKDSKGKPLPVCSPIQTPEKDNCRKMTYSQRAGGSQRD